MACTKSTYRSLRITLIGSHYFMLISCLIFLVMNEKNEPIEDRHRHIAAALQRIFEETCFRMLEYLVEISGSKNLACGRICHEFCFQR